MWGAERAMDFDQIRRYWEERASSDASAQSTTRDVYLREIEARVLGEQVTKLGPRRILDVGCGDARTTIRLAAAHPKAQFVGGDYAPSMLKNAEANVAAAGLANLCIAQIDVIGALSGEPFDLVYTTRCLINLPAWDMQRRAIDNILGALATGGVYVMIENFIEGHRNFNRVRDAFGLQPIAVRSHNLFFERAHLLQHLGSRVEVTEEINISSAYYLASRVLYSRICRDSGTQPDYFDAHHRYASALPFCGEFGPVRMLCLRKK
jgi:SAM-dependent methyltransferase